LKLQQRTIVPTFEPILQIQGTSIGPELPTYFIADIAANHDGDLERAKDLIHRCAEAGANAAKFQHFRAATIVSDHGFRSLGGQQSHQARWIKSVFEVYRDASVSLDWTPALKETCDKVGIAFFTSPYAFDLVDHIDPYVPAYKIGSGEITWIEMVEYIAAKGKPCILASGASSLDDVHRAMWAAAQVNRKLCLMQCNTNYTASAENFRHIMLNVLRTYREMYPGLVLGLSDHTPGHATVLGAVALGARMVEKHFTDDTSRIGPDHAFSMDPRAWRDMVDRTRELENALGTGVKKVEDNEKETVVLQRRSVRAKVGLPGGQPIGRDQLELLRPCPVGAIEPYRIAEVVGRRARRDIVAGEHLQWNDIE
jgi:sialic acid synthase SpsE